MKRVNFLLKTSDRYVRIIKSIITSLTNVNDQIEKEVYTLNDTIRECTTDVNTLKCQSEVNVRRIKAFSELIGE